jgi:hypothetical protein
LTSTGPDPTGFQRAGGQPDPADLSDVFSRLTRPAAALLETYARVMSQVAGGLSDAPGARRSGLVEPVGLAAAVIEAAAIASGSSLRYAQRLSEVMARHETTLLNATVARLAAEEPSAEDKRADVEGFRQFLREISQIALLEAHRLEHELERLGEAVAQGVAPAGSAEEYRRTWEAKP